MTATTIQVSKDLLQDLKSRKMYDKESYEDIIRDLLEDSMELSEQTLANIRKSEAVTKVICLSNNISRGLQNIASIICAS